MLNRKPLQELVKDYSLAVALFAFGVLLILLNAYTDHTTGFFMVLAGMCSILAGFVSAALMRFFHL
jgi:general stress protein CsbA